VARVAGYAQEVQSALVELAVLRPGQWLHFAALPLAGVSAGTLTLPSFFPLAALALFCASAALGWAYGINAIADRRTDSSSDKNPLAGATDVRRSVVWTVIASGIAALGAGAALGPHAFACAAASVVASGLYSIGPRMKARRVAGLLFNTAIFTPLTGLLLPSSGSAPAHFSLVLTIFVAMLLQSQLLHELQDAEEDAAGGARTTASLFGPRWTRITVALLAVPVIVCAVWMGAPLLLRLVAGVAVLVSGAVALAPWPPEALRRIHRQVGVAGGAALLGTAWILECLG
jgi:4-hydroxybenzoate polyprenyltransferase